MFKDKKEMARDFLNHFKEVLAPLTSCSNF